MIAVLICAATAMFISLLCTPLLIKFLHKREYGQFIRQDGPKEHLTKRGTPTMGGVVIIFATVVSYAISNLVEMRVPHASGIILLFLIVGMGLIGFLDDYAKIAQQRSLGLKAWQKIVGQAVIGIVFSAAALGFANHNGVTPASMHISFAYDSSFNLGAVGAVIGVILFIIWVNFLVTAWSNAVNLTDGLDGLAAGACTMVFAAYTLIGVWQSNHFCAYDGTDPLGVMCYQTRDPRDLAMIAAALMGGCFGFLWWNASPAKIFMGDTGSLALGAAFAGLSILSRTEFLALIIGGLFLAEVLSDVIQVSYFKTTRKRVFRMAPIHHHFELLGWSEVNVVIRFWIVAGVCVIAGLGIFYAAYWVG